MSNLPVSKMEFVQELVARAATECPDVSPVIAEHFAERFFRFVPYADVLNDHNNTLVDAALVMLKHIATYTGPTPKVSVLEQPCHTVIAALQPDSPFLVDSIRMEIHRLGLSIRSILSVVLDASRDASGQLNDVGQDDHVLQGSKEAAICVETEPLGDTEEVDAVRAAIEYVLEDVRLSVADFGEMRERALAEAAYLQENQPPTASEDIAEAQKFLQWLTEDHFIFLGFDEHRFQEEDGTRVLHPVQGSALGTMKRHAKLRPWVLDALSHDAREFIESPSILTFVNSTHRSLVHRRAYPDYITVKRFNAEGQVISACRFLGLFTSAVYNELPREIPMVRRKVEEVLAKSGFGSGGHYQKALIGVLNGYPRDELFQATADELFDTAMGIVQLQEIPRVRLFLRRNPYGRFYYGQVFIPKDLYHTDLRKKIQDLLCERLQADDVELQTHMGEGELGRLRFLLRIPETAQTEVNVRELEHEVVAVSRSWEEAFQEQIRQNLGESAASPLIRLYRGAFPLGYQDHFSTQEAIADLDSVAELDQGAELSLRLAEYSEKPDHLSFRLFHRDVPVPLSDILPILESMGLRADSEHPYRIERTDGTAIWVHEFHLIPAFGGSIEVAEVAEVFREAFLNIWQGEAENDRFNTLILGAGMTWREVALLRAYARYNRQARFGFGTVFTAETLTQHLEIAALLRRYFHARFDPNGGGKGNATKIEKEIQDALELVPSLNEDRVLRRFLELMKATLRTNFFQTKPDGSPKSALSLKFNPAGISGLPLPRPAFEIFVYSPRVEGIHLRGGKIARGGLRWSDRPEDFRTEVLGLVKAQQVKNAVIVPVGAKGGFVAQKLPVGDRQAIMEEGKECYRTFLRGLLDLTDNLVDGEVIPPPNVVRHDPDDPYLVVAADKGTATFSDIGNAVAAEYGFWLGDAFASGGSEGYDHKKMGITARGAWISVQRHFAEIGINVQKESITVVGIGDMAGDVFGNGMLCSEQIQLVAAFNHLHIFIDPNPNAQTSFAERQRLFEKVAGWGDYDTSLISDGGAIFSREQKVVELSPQIRERFAIKAEQLTPGELITALLRARVDLLWNGGIGTFAKASSESHEDAGDRANDALRVNASELGCKVIGEGGNLGFTQRARVEFCLKGGACNTDFIDNSAGVDCSDHEVNLKIPLNGLIAKGAMTREDRNDLLVGMTDAIAHLVLQNNYRQTRAITLAQTQSLKRTVEYMRLLDQWERNGDIDRDVEALPLNEALTERVSRGHGLTRPELSVLIAYSKSILKQTFVKSDIPEDPLMSKMVEKAFPAEFVDRFRVDLAQHQLRREIVATQWANDLVNLMGPSYIYRLEESTGATPAEIGRAYAAARDIFSLPELWNKIESLDLKVEPSVQHHMMYELSRLVRRGSRWLIRNCREDLGDLPALVSRFRPGVQQVAYTLHGMLHEAALAYWQKNYRTFTKAGVPEDLAAAIAGSSGVFSSLGVVFAAERTDTSIELAAEVYYAVSDRLDLHWLSYRIRDLSVSDHWEARARESFRDELHIQQRKVTISVLEGHTDGDPIAQIDAWCQERQRKVDRWTIVLEEFRAAGNRDYSVYPVVLRELSVLVET